MRTLLLFLLLGTTCSLHAQSDSLAATGHSLTTDLLHANESTKAPRPKKAFLFFGSEKRRTKDPKMPSQFAAIRRIHGAQPGMPYSTIGAGVRYSLFSLEGNMFVGQERKWWFVTPKANISWGNVSVNYGYGLPLGANDLPESFRHSVTVKYFADLRAFFARTDKRKL